MKKAVRIATAVLLASGVAACGGGDNSASTTPPVIVPQAKVETLFGSQFATDFEANPNTDPVKVNPGDIIPLSLTTEPVKLK